MRHSRRILAVLVAVVAIFSVAAAVSASVSPTAIPVSRGVRIEPIGNPTWMPVDFHLFAAPIGTEASGFEEFFHETMPALLPPPNHTLIPWTGIFPGAPHAGPYDSELANGVSTNGYREHVRFLKREFKDGRGIMLVYMTVPYPGTTGSSPDSPSGPIIPHSLFPIHVEGVAKRNGRLFDPYLVNTDVPVLGSIGYPGYDGHSHFPMFIVTNLELHNLYGLKPVKANGSYLYVITMLDQSGNGWRIRTHFAVTP